MNQRITTLLMISVIFNALFIGMILGETSHFFSHSISQVPETSTVNTSECCASKTLNSLSQEKQALLENILRPAWQSMLSTHDQLDKEKKKALVLLKAKQFDEKAYRAQIRGMNEIHNQMKLDMAEAVIKVAKQFTAEERLVLVDIVAHLSVNKPQDCVPVQQQQ